MSTTMNSTITSMTPIEPATSFVFSICRLLIIGLGHYDRCEYISDVLCAQVFFRTMASLAGLSSIVETWMLEILKILELSC